MDAVMHIAPVPPLRTVALAVALLMLLGCAAQPPPPPPKVLTAEEAAARTVVPLTRPIALDKAGQIVNLEFELPPAGADLAPAVLIGLRVAGDEESAEKARWLLNGYDLMAKVQLFRKGSATDVRVPLKRYDVSARRVVQLDPEGLVPQTIVLSPAPWPLQDAGLVSPALHYASLGLAFVPDATPGQYRLSIDLLEDRPELKDLNAELYVAYMGRSK